MRNALNVMPLMNKNLRIAFINTAQAAVTNFFVTVIILQLSGKCPCRPFFIGSVYVGELIEKLFISSLC